jgi:fibronectin type 3 domain-containing protein
MKRMKKLLTLVLVLAIVGTVAVVPAGALSIDAQNVGEVIAAAVGEKAESVHAEDDTLFEDTQIIERDKESEIAETGAENYPVITAADATANGIRIQWKAFAGAAKYRVFYKNDNGKWAKLGDTTGLYYDHKSARLDEKYVYTVRAIGSDGAYCSSYYTSGVTGRKSNPPTISKVENIAGGVTVSFTRPSIKNILLEPDVVYLYVTGGTYGSKWKLIGSSYGNTVSGPIDAKNSGSTLKYTLRSKNASGNFTSVCSTVKSATYVATPVFSVNAAANGQQIKITAVKGAAKYRIFIMGSNSKWQKLVDTTATTYVNKNVKIGGMYCYTVRALNSAGSYVSGYIKTGISVRYLATPKLTNLEQGTGYLKLSWGAVQNAQYYRVFRINPGESKWTALVDVAGTSYTDYDLVGAGKYTYTVRCIDNLGYYTSYFDTKGLSLNFSETPEIVFVENDEEGMHLYWTECAGVAKYRLFRMVDGKWAKVADTEDLEYTVTDMEVGQGSVFTVRGMNADGKYVTGYDPNGFQAIYYQDVERSINEDLIIGMLRQRARGKGMTYSQGIAEDADVDQILIATDAYYGENTGEVSDYVIMQGYRSLEEVKEAIDNTGYPASDFVFDITMEEYEGDHYFILNLMFVG